MIINVNHHTLLEIKNEYLDAIKWLATLGYMIERGRLDLYKNAIKSLADSFNESGWGDPQNLDQRKHLTTVMLEVRELISIYRGLSHNAHIDSDYKNRLKLFIKGPFHVNDEKTITSSNRARNIAFELYLCSLFSASGFDLVFGSNADLSFPFEDFTYFIECKRPQYSHQINSCLKSATKQLSKRYNQGRPDFNRGIIALDLSRVFNRPNYILSVLNEQQITPILYSETERFIHEYRKNWNRNKDKRTLSVFVVYRLLINIREKGLLSTVRWLSNIYIETGMPKDDSERLERVVKKIGREIRSIC